MKNKHVGQDQLIRELYQAYSNAAVLSGIHKEGNQAIYTLELEPVTKIVEEIEAGKSLWTRFFEHLGSPFKEKLGLVWEDWETQPYPPTGL